MQKAIQSRLWYGIAKVFVRYAGINDSKISAKKVMQKRQKNPPE